MDAGVRWVGFVVRWDHNADPKQVVVLLEAHREGTLPSSVLRLDNGQRGHVLYTFGKAVRHLYDILVLPLRCVSSLDAVKKHPRHTRRARRAKSHPNSRQSGW